MKLFLGTLPYDLKTDKYKFYRILVSYYMFRTTYKSLAEKLKQYDLFVDSGAFSAWSRKTKVNLAQYIEFIKENDLKVYAGLDVIYDPEATRKNFETMLSEGLAPIPTFHYGSDIKELEYFSQFPYIALGGLVPLASQKFKMLGWLDYCFGKIIKKIQNDKLKVHGFGILNIELLKRYPFFSVDGTSWNIGRKFGGMYEYEKGKTKRVDTVHSLYLRRTKNDQTLSQKNIDAFRDSEKFVTDLWKERGIVFED